jgi:N-acetylmuramoyl-L-alanine amidase
MAKVFIGVGHGGSDPGAVANGVKEKDANLAIALACGEELTRHGVTVGMSRTKDENDGLSEEIRECNAFNPALAVEIHNNAGGGDGAEVYHSINGGKGRTLANNILEEVKAVGQNSRGAKTKTNSSGADYYGFIRSTNAPAVIVECAFLDNKKDVQIIDTAAEQKAMGVAIAKGVLKTLGIANKPVEAAKPAAKPKSIYRVQVGAFSVKRNAERLRDELKGRGYAAIIVED